MAMKVVVLGGGNTGCTMAAEFSLRSFEVTVWEEKEYWHENIDGIIENGNRVELVGQDLTGVAKIHTITDNFSDAVENADIIFVSIVAWRHKDIIERMIKVLKGNQTVIFSAGNCASIRLREAIGKDHPAIVGEMSGNIFPCRMIGPGKAIIAAKYMAKKIAAFPGKDTQALVESVSRVIDCYPGENVLEAALNAPNVVSHLAGTLLNAASVERKPDFSMFSDGLSPAVVKTIQSVEAEKKRVMERMGYESVAHSANLVRMMDYDNYPELDDFRSLKGPNSLDHRYVKEDAACGDSLILSLADRLGIEMPVLRSLVTLASAINGCDYASEGITLKKLGVNGVTPEEINAFLFNAEND